MAKKKFQLDDLVSDDVKTEKKDIMSGLEGSNIEKPKQSLINPNLDDIRTRRGPKEKNGPKLKKVNTKLPQKLVTSFLMYCVSVGKFQKEVYPEMVQFLLEKYSDRPLEIKNEMNGIPIDFETEGEQTVITLEITSKQHQDITMLKVRNSSSKIKLKDIHGQIILQYLHEKQFNPKF